VKKGFTLFAMPGNKKNGTFSLEEPVLFCFRAFLCLPISMLRFILRSDLQKPA